MKAVLIGLAIVASPFAAQAGEAVTYAVESETFEGYRSPAKGDSKGLVLIIHDWDGLTEYEVKRADMLADMGYDAFAVDLFGKGNRPTDTAAKKKETSRLYQDLERMRRLIVGGLQEAQESSDKKTVVMITNDIDEAILLADTIYTLTASPGATLGPAVRVEAPHPRSRSQLSREPGYQRARRETVGILVSGQNGRGTRTGPAQAVARSN